jgi:hypothetical protein
MEDKEAARFSEEGQFISDKPLMVHKHYGIRGCFGPIFYFFAWIPPLSCWVYVSSIQYSYSRGSY